MSTFARQAMPIFIAGPAIALKFFKLAEIARAVEVKDST